MIKFKISQRIKYFNAGYLDIESKKANNKIVIVTR